MERPEEHLISSSNAPFPESSQRLYNRLSEELLQSTLHEHTAFHHEQRSNRWKLLRQDKSAAVYASTFHDLTGESRKLMISGLIPGSIEQVARGLCCDTTDTLVTNYTIHDKNFLNGAVLHTFEKGSLDSPLIYCGIKWLVFRPVVKRFISDLDLLVYERLGYVESGHGESFLYITFESVELSDYPRNNEANMTRVSRSICILYHRVSEQSCRYFLVSDTSKEAYTMQSDYYQRSRLQAMANPLPGALARAYSSLMVTNTNALASTSTHCDVCNAPKALFNRLYECKGCHIQMCRKCRYRRTIFRLHLRKQKPVEEDFCRDCVASIESNHFGLPYFRHFVQADVSPDSNSSFTAPRLESLDYQYLESRGTEFCPTPYSPTSTLSMRDLTDRMSGKSCRCPTMEMPEDEKELTGLWSNIEDDIEWNRDEWWRFSLQFEEKNKHDV